MKDNNQHSIKTAFGCHRCHHISNVPTSCRDTMTKKTPLQNMSTATVFNLRAKRARRSDLDYFEPFGFFQHSLPGRRDTQASHCTDISVCVFAFWQCYKILKRKSKGKEGEEEKNFNTAVYSVLISCLGFCGKLCVCSL